MYAPSQVPQPFASEPAVTRSVFVGDLSFFCTEIDLAALFCPFGRIDCVEIKRGRYGDSLMHGFVEYENEASAQLAIKEMHGKKFMGRVMRVNRTNVKVQPNPELRNWVQLHVNFHTANLQAKVSEEFLESVFQTFGSLGDITVKRHLCSRDPPQVSGYAFVYFLDAYAALRATHALKGACIPLSGGAQGGVHLECCLSYKAEQALLRQSGLPAGLIRSSSTSGTKKPQHLSVHTQGPAVAHQRTSPKHNLSPVLLSSSPPQSSFQQMSPSSVSFLSLPPQTVQKPQSAQMFPMMPRAPVEEDEDIFRSIDDFCRQSQCQQPQPPVYQSGLSAFDMDFNPALFDVFRAH